MKYLSAHPRTREYLAAWADGKQLAIAKFFFWRHGTKYQKSLNGLLRSPLHSILDRCPDLIKTTFPEHWEMARKGEPLNFQHDHIKEAFNRLFLGQ
jgi:hypothetical protein